MAQGERRRAGRGVLILSNYLLTNRPLDLRWRKPEQQRNQYIRIMISAELLRNLLFLLSLLGLHSATVAEGRGLF
ncbi:hypothetical protein H206_03653 [Candidatus Electrothrix aarhusensis]|uniref:Uncharacterized protein n=1 Tax=Candidatus Electrothrix aarhusensis TaxID=1859131 RepID=A0A3S3QDE7_9BACT|nr:hypothetical protein H206_03653 [Candidatus Electrothrix aarhusensis]